MNWRGLDHAQIAQRRLQEREQAYEESLADDLGEDFSLPITHRPSENVDTDNMEQASVDTQLSSSNVGFRLLQKMGWKGKGLGKDEQGIVEPIKAGARDAKLGVGKQEEDDYYTAEENIHRKRLEVEIMETEELVKKREVEAERELKIQSEVKEIRKAFFCDLCNKQYKLAVEFETHLSSYDHNHKKRFKEMRDLHSNRDRDDRQKREQMRQEKEMAKLQAEAQRQQQEQLDARSAAEVPSISSAPTPDAPPAPSPAADKPPVKFGFPSRALATKVSSGVVSKKMKVVPKVASVFNADSDEET